MTDICLVHMPFSLLGNPSMALSVLKTAAVEKGLTTVVEYGNLRFARQLSLATYMEIMDDMGMFSLLGELYFGQYAGFSAYRGADDYFSYARTKLDFRQESLKRLYDGCYQRFMTHSQALDKFLDEMVEVILSYEPKIVGCDITYQQQNATLALLKRLKERAPQLVTVLGGNSCTGSSGQALADYMQQVDFVFSGEADDLFPDFCQAVLAGASKAQINERFPSALIAGSQQTAWGRQAMHQMSIPDFTDYFHSLSKFALRQYIDPCLLIEGSRGCWWGEKNRCTFCGIHTSGETLRYRQKDSKAIVEELCKQAARYGINSFIFTDCILSKQHLSELLPLLHNCHQKFKLFAEVKSNLTKQQVQALREAGFVYLQPGIESLQDDILQLMNKGNRAIKHVELLKHARTYGIHIIWNLLCDMPGDRLAYYQAMTALVPLITHLYPPAHFNNIIYQRNSLYCQQPTKYQLQLETVILYKFTSLDDADFIERSAEFFLAKPIAVDAERAAKEQAFAELKSQIKNWQHQFAQGRGDRLNMRAFDDRLEICDLRQAAAKSFYTLRGLSREIYLLADLVISQHSVEKTLLERHTAAEIKQAIDDLLAAKLICRINDEILALAIPFPALPYERNGALPTGKIQINKEMQQ